MLNSSDLIILTASMSIESLIQDLRNKNFRPRQVERFLIRLDKGKSDLNICHLRVVRHIYIRSHTHTHTHTHTHHTQTRIYIYIYTIYIYTQTHIYIYIYVYIYIYTCVCLKFKRESDRDV